MGSMLRFILKNSYKDSCNGAEVENFFTMDFEVPELEQQLRRGGFGENGYQFNQLVGVEVLKEKV